MSWHGKRGKTQQWISLRLRFGRYLTFTTNVVNADTLPNNLTEGRFRAYWDQTDKDEPSERVRFEAVHRMIAADLIIRHERHPRVGKTILEERGFRCDK